MENTGYTYRQATGKLPYMLTNDYLFRAVLQQNNRVLKHLTCSLMHLEPEAVKEVRIENPIVLGEAVRDKEFILDVKVSLNNQEIINYEMQIVKRGDWIMRSMVYLCREFDQLQHGESYKDIRPVTHIGFLDYTLFPENPEFHAVYRMANTKNHNIYTDKFTLSVVDLSRIDLATAEDRAWRTDHWASLFKATTWEEIKMLAEKNEIIQEAADTVFHLTQDDLVRAQCWAREDHYRTLKSFESDIKELESEIGILKGEYDTLKDEHDTLKGQNDALKGQNDALKGQNDALKGQNDALKGQNDTLKGQNDTLKGQNDTLKGQNDTLKAQNDTLKDEISTLRDRIRKMEEQSGGESRNRGE